MQDTYNIIEREEAICAHNYHPLPIVLSRGSGIWLWDVDGKRYLDMMSAYSAVSHGHSHPKMIEAAKTQIDKLCITSRAFYTDKLSPFLEKLCDISGMDKALPMNTGAEAVETAIKASRKWGYEVKGIPNDKAEIIVAKNNFHGRTTTIISFSTDPVTRKGFGPLTPGFKIVDFGDIESLKNAINANTCAVMLEPIQGEAGIIIPPAGYFKQVSEICAQKNVLLILDEVQSGLGRTGKMFAFEHEGIKPDGLILGKALGGGIMPVSAFLAKSEVMNVFVPGSHGSTFGGNPLAAAVGYSALKVLIDEELVQKSRDLGLYMKTKLEEINNGAFVAIRGRGLWIGADLNHDCMTGREFCLKLMEQGILAKDTQHHTIRFAPPLVITKEDVDWAIGIIKGII